MTFKLDMRREKRNLEDIIRRYKATRRHYEVLVERCWKNIATTDERLALDAAWDAVYAQRMALDLLVRAGVVCRTKEQGYHLPQPTKQGAK